MDVIPIFPEETSKYTDLNAAGLYPVALNNQSIFRHVPFGNKVILLITAIVKLPIKKIEENSECVIIVSFVPLLFAQFGFYFSLFLNL